jgi:hypothetical protein
MAREIKVTTQGVRNITDTLSLGEPLTAARWQSEGEVVYFANDKQALENLMVQTGCTDLGHRKTIFDFRDHIEDGWGWSTAEKAVGLIS